MSSKIVYLFLIFLVLFVLGSGVTIYNSTSLPVRAELDRCANTGVSIAFQFFLGFGTSVHRECQIPSGTTWVTDNMGQLCVKEEGQVTCYYMGMVPDSVSAP